MPGAKKFVQLISGFFPKIEWLGFLKIRKNNSNGTYVQSAQFILFLTIVPPPPPPDTMSTPSLANIERI